MLKVPDLIDEFERRGVVQAGDAARLRQLHENAPQEFSPRVLLKWLVNRNKLTASQVERILSAPPSAAAGAAIESAFVPAGASPQSADLTIDYDEDTKDLAPEIGGAEPPPTLPPRGAPPFAETELVAQPVPRIDSSEAPRAPSPKADPGSSELSSDSAPMELVSPYRSVADELFAGEFDSNLLSPLHVPTKKRGRRRLIWDSPLMLVGGSALVVLILGAAFLLWRINRQSGDEAFTAAEAAYSDGTYSKALELYDQFLTDYPRHVSADRAFVHRGLTRLRLAAEGGADWPTARRTAEEVLKEIAPREEFGAAHADLSVLLTDIAQGAARAALEKNDQALADESEQALRLIDSYLPSNEVLKQRQAQTESLLTIVRRRLDRDRRANETAVALAKAVEAADFAGAYAMRERLLRDDPDVLQTTVVATALQSLAAASSVGVKFELRPLKPTSAERDGFVPSGAVLVDRQGGAVAELQREVRLTVAGGVTFAVEAATGKVLWRRPIGFDSAFAPRRIAETPEADVLLHDSRFGELLIIEAASGKLRRRIPLFEGEASTDRRFWISQFGGRLFVTFSHGSLRSIDLATGESAGIVRFPQPLQEATAVDPRGRNLYQFARSGALYILSTGDLKCLEAIALDHTEDSISTSPTCLGTFLISFERTLSGGQFVVFETDKQGLHPQRLVTVPLAAPVDTPPQVSQRFLAVVDRAGNLGVYDLSQKDLAAGLRPSAQFRCTGGDKIRRFLSFRGGRILVAGAEINQLEFQPALNKLSLIRSLLPGIIAESPPQLWDEHLLAFWRAPPGEASIVGLYATDSALPIWTARFGASLLGPPSFDAASGALVLAASAGNVAAIFRITPDQLQNGAELTAPAARTANVIRPEGELFHLGGEAKRMGFAWVSQDSPERQTRLATFAPTEPTLAAAEIDLPERTAAAPIAFRAGIVVPSLLGQVHYLDPLTAQPLAQPFQPALTAGKTVAWSPPAVDADAIYLGDGALSLYRLTLDSKPPARLIAAKEASLTTPIVGRPAVIEKMFYTADDSNTLLCFSLPDLELRNSWDLVDRLTWGGPVRAGNLIYAASLTDEGLICRAFNATGGLAWTRPFPATAWPPIAVGEKVYVVDSFGVVMRIDPADGHELKRVETGLSLQQPAVAVGEQLLLSTLAGELVLIPQP